MSSSTSHLEEPQNDPKPLNILTYAVVLLSVSNSPPDRVRPLNLFRSHYHFSYTHLVLSCLTLSYLPCNTLKRSRQHSKEKKKKSNFLFVYNKAFYLLAQVALLYIALLSSLPTAMTASFPHSSPFRFILHYSTILSSLSFLSLLFSLLSIFSFFSFFSFSSSALFLSLFTNINHPFLSFLSLLQHSFHLFLLISIILSFLFFSFLSLLQHSFHLFLLISIILSILFFSFLSLLQHSFHLFLLISIILSFLNSQPFTSDSDGKFAFIRQPNAMGVNVAVLGDPITQLEPDYLCVYCFAVMCVTVKFDERVENKREVKPSYLPHILSITCPSFCVLSS